MHLQGNKCVYCERQLLGIGGKAAIEHDMEHFRPKGRVTDWYPDALRALAEFSGVNTLGGAASGGYYQLTYHPLNYAAACKRCNSALKIDRFPVLGSRTLGGCSPAACASENSLLVYPIGSGDVDPETLIEFYGPLPRPKPAGGRARQRALAIIQFFELDAPELVMMRAERLIVLFLALRATETDPTPKFRRTAARVVMLSQSEHAPFANFARCFVRLYRSDPDRAQDLYENCVGLVDSFRGG